MKPETEMFKGHLLCVLKKDAEDPRPFKFGLSKARLIIDNYEQIKEFVKLAEEQEKERKSWEGFEG